MRAVLPRRSRPQTHASTKEIAPSYDNRPAMRHTLRVPFPMAAGYTRQTRPSSARRQALSRSTARNLQRTRYRVRSSEDVDDPGLSEMIEHEDADVPRDRVSDNGTPDVPVPQPKQDTDTNEPVPAIRNFDSATFCSIGGFDVFGRRRHAMTS